MWPGKAITLNSATAWPYNPCSGTFWSEYYQEEETSSFFLPKSWPSCGGRWKLVRSCSSIWANASRNGAGGGAGASLQNGPAAGGVLRDGEACETTLESLLEEIGASFKTSRDLEQWDLVNVHMTWCGLWTKTIRVDFFSGPVKPTYPTEFQRVCLPAGSGLLSGNTEQCILLLSETHKICFR